MQITTESIKALREKSGAGIMECKRALQEASGDFNEAVAVLSNRGYEIARNKNERVTCQGVIESYIHAGSKVGALVEINCETDFVARTPEFVQMAHDIAMQVVATNPLAISREGIADDEEIADEDCLLHQAFIKDSSKTIQDIITEIIAKVRENIQVRRFVRFELGSDGLNE